jgi:predicted acyltransferase
LLIAQSRWVKALGLAAMGLACLGLGTFWAREFPIIKILWTSTYVLIAGGWSLLLLAFFYTIIDVLKFRAWAFFFVVIGVNAITIYVARHFIPFNVISRELLGGVAGLSGSFKPVVVPIGTLALEWLFLLHLYRNKIFLRV